MPGEIQNPLRAAALLPHPQVLDALNTMGLASVAEAFARLDEPAQLPALSLLAARYPRTLVLGGGSNLILPERVGGLVVQVALRGVRLLAAESDRWVIEAAGGEPWHGFVGECVARGWDGLENLALIPGTVGAAPVQNIGAYGVELSERFAGLTAWDISAGRQVDMLPADCGFGYRDSRFKHDAPGRWLITSVRFSLPRPWRPVLDYPDLLTHPSLARSGSSDAVTASMIFDAVCAVRRHKLPDPAVIGNTGSFFKNPVVDGGHYRELLQRFPALVAYPQTNGCYKLAAGWLIDQRGWKGRSSGAAGVHDRQALVLVNRGGARAGDILELAAEIVRDVEHHFGVTLQPEPVIVP